VNYIKSTYEVLAFKSLNRDVTESWIEWALQMIFRGHETEHLIILAGKSAKSLGGYASKPGYKSLAFPER
jgi:hypothetical protein